VLRTKHMISDQLESALGHGVTNSRWNEGLLAAS
jgi:hypothetical protein